MNAPEKCPKCGAVEYAEFTNSYSCGSIIPHGELTEVSGCLRNQRDQLTARVRQLEAVVTDPHALWTNWLRGDIQLPAGIGDIRECSEKMKRFRSRWLAAHQELRRTEDRVERAEERVKQLEDETARWAAAYRDLGTYKP